MSKTNEMHNDTAAREKYFFAGKRLFHFQLRNIFWQELLISASFYAKDHNP